MFRRLARLAQSVTSYSRRNCIAATSNRGQGAVRRRFFTPLRVELLENRALLTGDPTIQLDVDSSTQEGGSPVVVIWLSEPAPQLVSLNLEIRNQSGLVASDDWEVATTSIWIAAGEEYATWDWDTIDDLLVEATESFTFTISNPTNAVLGTSYAKNVAVFDNDVGLFLWWGWPGGEVSLTQSDALLLTGGGGSWTASGVDDQGRNFEAVVSLPELTGNSTIDVQIEGLPSDYGHWMGAGDPDPMIRPWVSVDFDLHSEDTLGDGGWRLVFPGVAPPKLKLTIYDGQGPAMPVDDAIDDKKGAVTVANMNDTDADLIADWEDHEGGAAGGNGVEETRTGANKHGRDEVDLMKLIVHKPVPYTGGAVTLTVTPAARVMLWDDSKKKTEIDAAYDPETGIATWEEWGGGGDRTIWVEITIPSGAVADVELTLEHEGFVPDSVKATGVWVTKTNSEFATKDWDPDLVGSIWDTDMDEPLQTRIANPNYGGTGKRPERNVIHEGATKTLVVNVMLMQFTVTPSDVERKLARVKFDLTRSMRARTWKSTFPGGPAIIQDDKEVPFPQLWEDPNDDPHDEGESDKVNASGRMYVIDTPECSSFARQSCHTDGGTRRIFGNGCVYVLTENDQPAVVLQPMTRTVQ